MTDPYGNIDQVDTNVQVDSILSISLRSAQEIIQKSDANRFVASTSENVESYEWNF